MTHARTLTGRHVLFIFMAFFITVTGVNALMVTFALKTFSGEDVQSAYVKGLNYNATLAEHDAEGSSGYSIEAGAVRSADDKTRVQAEVTQRGAALSGDVAVTATLRHPTNAHLDREITLAADSGGKYAAVVDGLSPGQWDIVVALKSGETSLYEARTRIWLR